MIDKYIFELINKHNKLILPELGAFLTKENPEDGSKTVFFNDVLKYNDGTLVNHIILKENISEDDAKVKVAEYITVIKETISLGNPFNISGFGMLFKDNKGFISFTSFESEVPAIEINEKTEDDDILELSSNPVKSDIIEDNENTELTSKEEILEIDMTEKEIKSENYIPPVVEQSENFEKTDDFKVIEQNPPVIPTFETPPPVPETKPEPIEENIKIESEEPLIVDKSLIEYSPEKVETSNESSDIDDTTKHIEKELRKEKKKIEKKSGSSKKIIIISIIVVPILALGVLGYLYKDFVIAKYHEFTGGSNTKKEIAELPKNDKKTESLTTNSTQNNIPENKNNTPETTENKQPENTNVTEEPRQESTTTKTEEKKPVAETPVVNTKPANTNGNLKFHVIIGSLNSQGEAEKYCKRMTGQGFSNARVLPSTNGKYRVAENSFATKEEAQDELAKLSANGTQAWILNQ